MSTTDRSTLSLHDALPILLAFTTRFGQLRSGQCCVRSGQCRAGGVPRGVRHGALRTGYGWMPPAARGAPSSTHRSEEHTSELQSRGHLVCRLLLEKKKNKL